MDLAIKPTAPLTEELMANIRRELASKIHLQAAQELAAQLASTPGGSVFLEQWAQGRRDRAEKATAPGVSAAMSQLMGDETREVTELMLRAMGL